METLPTLPKTVPEMWSLMRDAIGRRHVVDFFALRDLLCSILLLVEEIQQKTEQARVVEAETGEGEGEGETAEESEGKGEEGETTEEEDSGSGTEIPSPISFSTLSSGSLSDLTAEPPPKKTIAEKQRMQIRQKRAQKIKGGGQLVASGTAMATSKQTEDSALGSGSRSSHMPGLSQSLQKIGTCISSEGLMPTESSSGLRMFSAKATSGSSADLGAEMSRLLVCTANIRKEVNGLRTKSLERQAKLEDDILDLYELTTTLKKDSVAMMESYDLKIVDLKKNITLMRKDLEVCKDQVKKGKTMYKTHPQAHPPHRSRKSESESLPSIKETETSQKKNVQSSVEEEASAAVQDSSTKDLPQLKSGHPISPQDGRKTSALRTSVTSTDTPLQQQKEKITVQKNKQPAEPTEVIGKKINQVPEQVAQQRPRFSTVEADVDKSTVSDKDREARSRVEQIVDKVDTIQSKLAKMENRFSPVSLDFQCFGSGTPDIGPGDQQSGTQNQQALTRLRKDLAVLNRRVEAFQTQHTVELNTVRELVVTMNRENVVRWKELYKQLILMEEGGHAKKSHFWTSSITEAPTVIQGASDTIKIYGHGVFHPQPPKSQSEACSSDPMSQASPNAKAATSPWSLADLRKELMGHLKALRKRVTQVEMTVETSLQQAAGAGAGPSLSSLPGAPEAAAVRKPLVHTFNCLSCNKRVQLTQPRVDASSFPSSEFPPRCHSSPPLSAPRGGAFIEGHASSPSPPLEFPNLHLSNPPRSCGGSYTYQAKPRRIQFFSELRETIYNAATMPGKVHVKGADGNIYRGQVSLGL